ncbi:diguanylate cyclase [Kangiella shandongensis]|uniref:diguanylate cyclase n=1 Tax=Kangiella shandongensis TaxID=2763258 RepID=UPI001CC19630|nr:diguanylate cyclase [Kangiella shandongensis]
MKKIIIVDDSKFFCALVEKQIIDNSPFGVITCNTLEEAKIVLARIDQETIHACLISYRLRDTVDGEAVELFRKHKLPTLVLISDITARLRTRFWRLKVIDYFIKNDKHVVNEIVESINRLKRNPNNKIVIVEDSKTSAKILQTLLEVHAYDVIHFTRPSEAYDYVKYHQDVKMVITDYHMPEMDGCELTRRLRHIYSKQELAILGVSGAGQSLMAATFLKHGADDFIIKQSFLAEEFYLRVNSYLDRLNTYQELATAASNDFLTGIPNRRHFFNVTDTMHDSMVRQNAAVTCAMIDIDKFKQVNDKYGHSIGDVVLREVAGILRSSIRKSDVVARFGGEEFCMYMTGMPSDHAQVYFEKLRQKISNTIIRAEEHTLQVTVSIGVYSTLKKELTSMIEEADKRLYHAKESGRNRVIDDTLMLTAN